ncbi:hypothetical protein, partial [Stutzerimonas stutzeri]|uniref:hypothetical protein n=1 Tax=Stutzerimonas stutzeri TaxID=316 RepID=UPI0024B6AC18
EAACQQLQDAEDERENLAEARRILDLFEQLAPQRHRFLRLQDLGPLLDKAADSLARLFGRTQLLAGGAALALQLGQALLHGLFLMLQARQ